MFKQFKVEIGRVNNFEKEMSTTHQLKFEMK